MSTDILFRRLDFHRRVQYRNENVENFAQNLSLLASKCHFSPPEVEQNLIRDRFLTGLIQTELPSRIIKYHNNDDLTVSI
jgi:hypothetical protein